MSKQIKVLVVDDQPDEAKLIGLILKKEFSAEAKLVSSFEDALQEMRSGNYDIVTLDYQLNRHNGLELLKKTKSVDLQPPVVMVTGHGDEQTAVNAFKLGVSGYVVKDNRMSTLLVEEIRSALARSALAQAEKELEEKAEERELLLDNIPTMIWYLTNPYTFGAVNKAMSDFFGKDQQWFEGKHVADIMSEEEAEECIPSNKDVFESKEKVQCEQSIKNRDGKTHIFNIVKTPRLDPEGNVQDVVCTGEDITERKHGEEIVRVQRDLALQLSEDLEFDEILEKCIRIILDATGYDTGGAYLLDEETGGFKLIYETGAKSEEMLSAVRYVAPDHPRFPLLASGEHIYMNFKDFPIPADDARLKEGLKISSIFPIKDKDRVIGSINVASHTIDEVSEETKDLIESLSGQVGQILSRAIVDRARRNSEIRYRILFNSNRDGILYLDNNGDVIDANEAFQQMSGYSAEEIKSGIFPQSICPGKTPEMLEEFIKGIFKNGRPDDTECELKKKAGEQLSTGVKAWAVHDEQDIPAGVWMIFYDITKQIKNEKFFKAQRDLAMSALRTDNLNEILELGIKSILDLAGLDIGFVGFLREDDTTWTIPYYIGVSDEYIEAARKRVAVDPTYKSIQERGPIYTRYEDLPIQKDAVRNSEGIKALAILPIVEKGKMIAGVNIGSHTMEEIPRESRNIIEALVGQIGQAVSRYRLVSALRESEEVYRTLVETSPEPIIVRDLEDNIIKTSSSCVELLGYDSEEELLGKNVLELVADEYVEDSKEFIKEVLEKETISNRELEVIRKDGTRLPFLASTSLIRDKENNPKVMITVGKDLSESKKAEEDLAGINAELQRYAHTVSHDLKGPVSNVILASDLAVTLIEDISGSGDFSYLQKVIDSIRGHAEHTYELIQNLLKLAEAGQKPLQVEEVDVGESVKSIIGELSQVIKKNGVEIELDDDLGSIMADPTQIYQLFSNLIRNAIQHGECDSPLIEVRRLPSEKLKQYRYLVRDNGPGIPEDSIENLSHLSAGITDERSTFGLSIVAKIVKAYNGRIEAYNDNGACFELILSDAD